MAQFGKAKRGLRTFVLLLLGALALLSTISGANAQTTQKCNGFSALCPKKFSEVAFAVTHNAYAVGTSIASNQNLPITQQLKDGIRGFKLTVMRNPNGADPQVIHLCHGQCGDNTIFADGGPLKDTLTTFKTFLTANPNEVIVIFMENQKSITATDIMADFTSSGLADLCYAHSEDNVAWPTLKTMITRNKRCVVFVDRVVVAGSNDVSKSVDWFMAELGFVASNYWLNTVDTAWTCEQHQPYDSNSKDLIPRQLWLLNHMLYNNVSATVQVPARNKIGTTNTVQSVQDHVNTCFTVNGRAQVNFLSVDDYEQVDYAVLRIVDALNSVTRDSYGTPVSTTTRTGTTKTLPASSTSATATQGSTQQTLTRNPPSGASKAASGIVVSFFISVAAALTIL